MKSVMFPIIFVSVSILGGTSSVECLTNSAVGPDASTLLVQEQEKKQVDKNKKAKKQEPKNRAVALVGAIRTNYSKARFTAAKKFLIAQELNANIDLLERICQINKKQKMKLSIAAKGLSTKMADEWMEGYGERFRNLFGRAAKGEKADKDEEDEIVYKDVDDIDLATLNRVQTTGNKIYLGEKGPAEHKEWRKVLEQVLTADQLGVYRNYDAKRKAKIRDALLAVAVNLLDSRMDLSDDQLEKIKTLLKPELAKFKRPSTRIVYMSYITIYGLLQIDEKQIKEILTPAQQQQWKALVNPYKLSVQRIAQELNDEENEED